MGRQVKGRYDALSAGKDMKAFEKMRLLVEKILDPATPSYKILGGEAANLLFAMDIPRNEKEQWFLLVGDIEKLALARGHRDSYDILTLQEHKLIGSTCKCVEDDGSARARYTPVGVLSGKFGLEEARNARGLAAIIENFPYFTFYNAGKADIGPISLEPLDEKGMTVADPMPIGMQKFEDGFGKMALAELFRHAEVPLEKLEGFPFRRD
jgi:hypothetical protein